MAFHCFSIFLEIDLGSALKGGRRYFNATCLGPCEEVRVAVRVLLGDPNLFLAKDAFPKVRSTSIFARTAFVISTGSSLTATCQYTSIGDYNSFTLAVVADDDYEKAILTVEAFNFKGVTETTLPSKGNYLLFKHVKNCQEKMFVDRPLVGIHW